MVHKLCASSLLAEPGKRGPKTAESDSALRATIKASLASSPFSDEGHYLGASAGSGRDSSRSQAGAADMRENNLLSPFRGRRGSAALLTGGFASPDEMWGNQWGQGLYRRSFRVFRG